MGWEGPLGMELFWVKGNFSGSLNSSFNKKLKTHPAIKASSL